MTEEQRAELHRDRAKAAMQPSRPGDLVPQMVYIAKTLRDMGKPLAADFVHDAIGEIEHANDDL